jgi:hypothetical protein
VAQFDSRADLAAEARRSSFTIQRVRDAAHLNWRYVACPELDYHIVLAEAGEALLGYIVIRCVEQFGLSGGFI